MTLVVQEVKPGRVLFPLESLVLTRTSRSGRLEWKEGGPSVREVLKSLRSVEFLLPSRRFGLDSPRQHPAVISTVWCDHTEGIIFRLAELGEAAELIAGEGECRNCFFRVR